MCTETIITEREWNPESNIVTMLSLIRCRNGGIQQEGLDVIVNPGVIIDRISDQEAEH
jgi:hypothetical protein